MKGSMLWGYAGVFPGDFRLWDGDAFTNKLRFMAEHGFRATGTSLASVRDPIRLEQMAAFVGANDFRHSVHFGCKYFEDPLDVLHAGVERFLEDMQRHQRALGAVLVVTNCGPYHRFMRKPSLDFQMERLARVLTPLAAGCRDLGLPLGIENHCDYLLSDLMHLCRVVPHLGIFWDTGNSFMTGETPLEVSRLAAPYVVGTHFKDFTCFPDERELKLVVKGASLGDGDVGLDKIYRDLVEFNPNPEKLVMEFELIPDPGMSPLESLDRSKRFVEKISGFKFKYPSPNQIK